ncbi:MAG: sulfatase [Balneolaceae bacterium]|nr:sulfatase [Balneolaceae bacterium]
MKISNSFHSALLILSVLLLISCEDQQRPNILFAIADDATYKHFGAYGTDWIQTPAFDRVAEEGILFLNAYTNNAKCSPSRSILLTGRHSWQLEEAANHVPNFPEKFKTYSEVLRENGYHTGYTGKGWAPGNPGETDGKRRQLIGPAYNEMTTTPPGNHISQIDYSANFEKFLADKENDEPFSFWYGGYEPHRAYQYRIGIDTGGKNLEQIDEVPAFWPDNDTVRTDMLDYAYEIEYFDKHLQQMLQILETRGELDNTIVIVTSDNGMPFPRVKGQAYEYSNHMPLAIMWPNGIEKPGRIVNDFVSFIDIAPTLLELAGIDGEESGMQPITGQSFTDIFYSEKSGVIDPNRDHVLIGKERHDIGRPNDEGYPIRGIVTENYLYLHNFEPSRWPAGNPETGYLNTDGSPTKTWILDHQNDPDNQKYWEWSFGKRPNEELYNLNDDPFNVNNLVSPPENDAYRELAAQLKNRLFEKLEEQGDPRMFGNGEVFDNYLYSQENNRNFYEKYMTGELDESDAGWVNPTDFENDQDINE